LNQKKEEENRIAENKIRREEIGKIQQLNSTFQTIEQKSLNKTIN
jgi:hypothetical protein